jgi:hypothetical protein
VGAVSLKEAIEIMSEEAKGPEAAMEGTSAADGGEKKLSKNQLKKLAKGKVSP